ncbi:unnamed protein product [Urochloa humidicola]
MLGDRTSSPADGDGGAATGGGGRGPDLTWTEVAPETRRRSIAKEGMEEAAVGGTTPAEISATSGATKERMSCVLVGRCACSPRVPPLALSLPSPPSARCRLLPRWAAGPALHGPRRRCLSTVYMLVWILDGSSMRCPLSIDMLAQRRIQVPHGFWCGCFGKICPPFTSGGRNAILG